MPHNFVNYYFAFHHTALASRLLQASPLFAAGKLPIKSWKERAFARRYLAALLAPAVVAGLMQVTWPFFQHSPVLPYVLAVILCAWYGGLGPGLLSVAVSFLLTDFFFIEPYFSFGVPKQADLIKLLFFAVVGPFVSVISELMHKQRRRAEINLDSAQRAEESLSLFRNLMDQSSDAIEVLDPATLRFLDCNATAHQRLGYTREEFLSLTAFDIDPMLNQSKNAQLAEEMDKSSFVIFESVHRRKDGSTFPVELNVKNIRLERDYRLAVVRDITERKRAEEELRQSHWQLQNILDSLFEFVGVFSTEGVVLEANRAPLEAAALKREQVLGKSFPETYWWSYSAAVQDRLRAALQRSAQGEVVRYDEVIRVANDQRVTIDVVFGPLRDAKGEITQIVGCAVNITERKRAEEALKATSEQLRALSARLQSAREEEGTRIARELHDELGSSLTTLRWSLDDLDSLLAALAPEVDTDPLREKIATITTLVEGTLQTVRRISSELRPGILYDVGLLAAIEWEAQQFQARSGIVCYFDSSVEKVQLSRAQSTAVFRIFQEALTNVLRHAAATRVEIAIMEEEGALVLTISDDGRGITDEEKSGAQSLGMLGMRERAYLFGGEVDITGVENQGTVVTVRIPS